MHEELVNDALIALTEYIRRGTVDVPASWLGVEPPDDLDQERFERLGYTILRRRIVDHWRRLGVRRASGDAGGAAPVDELPDDSSERGPNLGQASTPPEHLDDTLLYARMMRICLRVLETLSAEERDLISFVGGNFLAVETAHEADGPTERQRLSRARAKLRSAVEAELGESVADLLRDAPHAKHKHRRIE